jgi:hypothetical protein
VTDRAEHWSLTNLVGPSRSVEEGVESMSAGRLSVVQQAHRWKAPTGGAVHVSCPPLQATHTHFVRETMSQQPINPLWSIHTHAHTHTHTHTHTHPHIHTTSGIMNGTRVKFFTQSTTFDTGPASIGPCGPQRFPGAVQTTTDTWRLHGSAMASTPGHACTAVVVCGPP